jgi:hypothetical protein
MYLEGEFSELRLFYEFSEVENSKRAGVLRAAALNISQHLSTSSLSCPSMAMVLVVLLATRVTAAMVLVDHRVTSSSSDEPAVERERRHEGDRQRERQAPPEQQARKPRLHRPGDD